MHEQTIFFDESTSINHYYNELIGFSEWTSEEHEFQHIQKAIDASYEGNYDLMKEMIKVSKTPFDGELENSVYAEAPSKDQRVTQTFCGT